jgi:hypothetical protein
LRRAVAVTTFALGLMACADENAGTVQGGVSTGDGGGMRDAAVRRDGSMVAAPDAFGRPDDDFGFEELDVPDDIIDEMSPPDATAPSGPPDAQAPLGFVCDRARRGWSSR